MYVSPPTWTFVQTPWEEAPAIGGLNASDRYGISLGAELALTRADYAEGRALPDPRPRPIRPAASAPDRDAEVMADDRALDLLDRAPWQQHAACRGVDPDLFFPPRGGMIGEAKEVCRGCEVRAECLDFAVTNRERFGVWGGVSERGRRRLRTGRSPVEHEPEPETRAETEEVDNPPAQSEDPAAGPPLDTPTETVVLLPVEPSIDTARMRSRLVLSGHDAEWLGAAIAEGLGRAKPYESTSVRRWLRGARPWPPGALAVAEAILSATGNDDVPVASLVAARLVELGRSQEWLGVEVAARLSRPVAYSRSTVGAWLGGRLRWRDDVLAAVAEVLDLPAADLLDARRDPGDPPEGITEPEHNVVPVDVEPPAEPTMDEPAEEVVEPVPEVAEVAGPVALVRDSIKARMAELDRDQTWLASAIADELDRDRTYSQQAMSSWMLGLRQWAPDVLFVVERALALAPGDLSRHLGYLPLAFLTPPPTDEPAPQEGPELIPAPLADVAELGLSARAVAALAYLESLSA